MTIFWFRRDLRLNDNTALNQALLDNTEVQPIFIFDEKIINELPADDPRVNFIYDELKKIQNILSKHGSALEIYKGNPLKVWQEIVAKNDITDVYFNHDYEPYARERDKKIYEWLLSNNIQVVNKKDQVIFEKSEVVKDDGKPYTVYTPFKNKWLKKYADTEIKKAASPNFKNLIQNKKTLPTKGQLGIKDASIIVKPFSLSNIESYDEKRNFPAQDAGSYLGPHLRFGTVSVRELVEIAEKRNATFLSELIWREFFMQILWHFPNSIQHNFKRKYDGVQWRNNKEEFKKWCNGETGYPIVDAGMRELNNTGYMHNRVRMITASFLVKHLLIDWRWGEAYFAKKLLDFELASNVGNWQWAAGTGCDAAPYFRVFNPYEQVKKFDKQMAYIKKWVPEFQELTYSKPMVDHKFARERALNTYKKGLN